MVPLILASTSRYRAELLTRLLLPFEAAAPNADETPMPAETAQKLAARLARAKAQSVAQQRPDACVIGSDQVASCMNRLLGKPGSRQAAAEQLSFMAGRTVLFATAVSLVHPELPRPLAELDLTLVKLRRIKAADIDRYLDAEPAFDCAGSFRAEGLGISLFEEIQSRDPTGLIGLPLIALARMLRKAGYPL
ncbi:MAG: septum formation inhibitor Maf [Panacagrimonas sp.]|jgi:septum formation protein|nr:Maf family nucleotide pyrophosphatase [Panacagrimonas sp.]MCC2657701.1 septum formation inhibitor Maf [Panacagrimonas sp.]